MGIASLVAFFRPRGSEWFLLLKSLARPGGNVTGITNISGELGGKRLELLKEAVPKVARVAVLFQSTIPSSVLELKDVLPVAARALGLTLQPLEIRGADDFEKVFAVQRSSARMDSTCSAGAR